LRESERDDIMHIHENYDFRMTSKDETSNEANITSVLKLSERVSEDITGEDMIRIKEHKKVTERG
jgi:uncharacterized membrane protein